MNKAAASAAEALIVSAVLGVHFLFRLSARRTIECFLFFPFLDYARFLTFSTIFGNLRELGLFGSSISLGN